VYNFWRLRFFREAGMIRYHQITCPHCQGGGVVRRHPLHEHSCPLCCGRGTINDFDRPLEESGEQSAPPADTSAELLSRVVPLGGRTYGNLLAGKRRRYKPQGIPIYDHDSAGRDRKPSPV